MLDAAAVIVHGKGYSVIGGERRVAAQLAEGARHINLYVIRSWDEFHAWLLLDERRDPLVVTPRHMPMSLVDAAYWSRKVLGNLRTRKSDAAERVLAESIGREVERIRDVKYQLHWLDNPDAEVARYAREQLRLVHQGVVSGSTISGRITRFVDSRTTMPIRQQRATLTAAASQFAGLADALRPLAPALSSELTDEEIDQALRHFTEGRLQAERVIRALKAIKENRPA
jgi:hypothetical protein